MGLTMKKDDLKQFLQEQRNYIMLPVFMAVLLLLAILLLPPVFGALFAGLATQGYRFLLLGLGCLWLLLFCLFCVYIILNFVRPIYRVWRLTARPRSTLQEEAHIKDTYLKHFEKWLAAQADEMIGEQLGSIADVKALQSQINPHFLYNTLDSLRGELYVREMDELADMVEMLSDLFRYSVGQNDPLIPLEAELENTEKYIRIMQFRFPNKIIVSREYDTTDNEIMNLMVPKLILQPIVENSISHGLEAKLGPGRLTLNIRKTDKTLLLSVDDDGLGISAERLEHINRQLALNEITIASSSARGSGLALLNINKRIQLLFGENYGVSVASRASQGTQVQIMLPLNRS